MLASFCPWTGLLCWIGGQGTLGKESELPRRFCHTSINLIDLTVAIVGAVMLTWLFARRNQVSVAPSLAISYEVLLPLGALPMVWRGAIWTLGPGRWAGVCSDLILALAASLICVDRLGFRPLVGGSIPGHCHRADRMLGSAGRPGWGDGVASCRRPHRPDDTRRRRPHPPPRRNPTPSASPTAHSTANGHPDGHAIRREPSSCASQ